MAFSLFAGSGRFFDPRTKQSFKYDHLRKETSDYQDMEADTAAESWRAALDLETMAYTASHYRHGVNIYKFEIFKWSISAEFLYSKHKKSNFFHYIPVEISSNELYKITI